MNEQHQMTPDDYLNKILNKISLTNDSDAIKNLRKNRDEVEKLLKAEYNNGGVTIRYAGSYSKDTMIRDSYDLDITCYFNHDNKDAGETLKDIFDNVKAVLSKEYFVSAKKSALRLQNIGSEENPVDFHIDVVPGRFVDDSKEDTYLHQAEGDKKWLKTNLSKHIEHIKGSGLTKTIRLIKHWNKLNFLNIKTFVLELLVVRILDDLKDKDGLSKCLTSFWERVKDNIQNTTIEDPANPGGNNLSEIFNDSIRQQLKFAAENALNSVENNGWEFLFGPIEEMSAAEKTATVQILVNREEKVQKPWLLSP
jgi:hypothetical protein